MTKLAKRYTVAKRDFGRGYVIVDGATGREIRGTAKPRRRDAADLAAKMNARLREAGPR